MHRYIFLIMAFFNATKYSYGQAESPTRYRDAVFTEVKVDKDITYKQDIPVEVKKKYYVFDLYQPAADTAASQKRPLLIWMHGGGFKFGSKNTSEVQLWCNSFAQRGFVCAAVNYRLSKKNTLFKFKALVSGAADAVEDVRNAIIFFKQHAKEYRLDTNRIILAGNSAGAIVALQAAYSTPAELSALAEDTTINKPAVYTGKIAAVVNFWGALFNIDWLRKASIPIVSVHGSNDHTVPANTKGTSFFGSIAIHKEADKLHIPNRLKIYEGYAHELAKHFNPLWTNKAAKQRRREAADFAAAFLYETLFK